MCSILPVWKQLITSTLSMDKRVSLIASIFSNSNEIESVGHLCGGDAQAFIDVADEVSSHLNKPRL